MNKSTKMSKEYLTPSRCLSLWLCLWWIMKSEDDFLQAGDKDSFKLQLNHVLCCRPWAVLPDMLDLFEQINHGPTIQIQIQIQIQKTNTPLPHMLDLFEQANHSQPFTFDHLDDDMMWLGRSNCVVSGKDLGHCMRKLMGKHTGEAFQPLCSPTSLPQSHSILLKKSLDAIESWSSKKVSPNRQLIDHKSHPDWLESQITGLHYLNCHCECFPERFCPLFVPSPHRLLLLDLLEWYLPICIFCIHHAICEWFIIALVFFSFHSGRTVSILRRRTVWRNRGSWDQWRETSENLCSPSWGGTPKNPPYFA